VKGADKIIGLGREDREVLVRLLALAGKAGPDACKEKRLVVRSMKPDVGLVLTRL
jgi:hypothetical protein